MLAPSAARNVNHEIGSRRICIPRPGSSQIRRMCGSVDERQDGRVHVPMHVLSFWPHHVFGQGVAQAHLNQLVVRRFGNQLFQVPGL